MLKFQPLNGWISSDILMELDTYAVRDHYWSANCHICASGASIMKIKIDGAPTVFILKMQLDIAVSPPASQFDYIIVSILWGFLSFFFFFVFFLNRCLLLFKQERGKRTDRRTLPSTLSPCSAKLRSQ